MNKINVFKNGSEMPWTYYQADLLDNKTGKDNDPTGEAKKRLMFTSEAKRNDSQGQYVTQISKYIQTGVSTANYPTFKKISINNPTAEDYKAWGWPLPKNELGEESLPKYGEFRFIPGCEPSYEDLSCINMKFKFGFGLNNTCYNFATEISKLQVYNLSCAPRVFCSKNQFCDITYNKETKSFSPDFIPEQTDSEGNFLNKICCDIKEGTGKKAYLFVAVESGEQIKVSTPYSGTDLACDQIDVSGDDGIANQGAINDAGSTVMSMDLSSAYRVGVEGEQTLEQASVGGVIKMDFYRLTLTVRPDYVDMCYNKDNKLCIYLKITPKTYGNELPGFERTICVQLQLTKNIEKPNLGKTYYKDVNNKVVKETLHSTKDNMRQRVVVTAKEAINYAITHDEGDVPAFLEGEGHTLEAKYKEYKESLLTETEKALDAYKLSFNTQEMREKLAFYVVTDLSEEASANLETWNATGAAKDSSTCDLSDLLKHPNVTGLKASIATELTANNKPVTLNAIKQNSTLSTKFHNLMKHQFTVTPTAPSDVSDLSNVMDNSEALPWMDTRICTQRKFGSIMDVSCAHRKYSWGYGMRKPNTALMNKIVNGQIADGQVPDTSGQRKTLMGHPSTLLTLLYALHNEKKTGSDTLINRYRAHMNSNTGITSQGTELKKLYNAMRDEYHNKKNFDYADIKDPSGASACRPKGLFDELYKYRYKLNPVDGPSGIKYLCDILAYRHNKSAPDRVFYGSNALNEAFKQEKTCPSKAEVQALLYGTGIAAGQTLVDKLRGSEQTINTDVEEFDGVKVDLDNEFLTRSGLARYTGTSSAQNIPNVRNTSTAVFYKNDKYNVNTNGPNWVSDFKNVNQFTFSADQNPKMSDVSCIDLVCKYVYNGNVGRNANTQATQPYATQNFHPENCDFSGVMKLPQSSGGKYVDVYLKDNNGKFVEIRETVFDTERITYETDCGPLTNDQSYNMDMSTTELHSYVTAANGNDTLRDEVKDSRKTLIKNLQTKFDVFNVGIYQVFRYGNVLRWVANVEDLDAEQKPAMVMPELKLKYRHDVDETCVRLYKENCLALSDVESTLVPKINTVRSDVVVGVEAQNVLTATTGAVLVSRWGTSYVPLDVSGSLERGECFTLKLSDDKYNSTQHNNWGTTNATFNTQYTSADGARRNFEKSLAVPEGCEDQKIVLEYMDTRVPGSRWTPVGNKEFVYECHDYRKTYDATAVRNTHGQYSNEINFTNTKSSNVKGGPRFRLCIPSQNKLLQLWNTSSASGSNNNNSNFGALVREVKISLKYTKSAKIKAGTNKSKLAYEKDKDGNNKEFTMTAIVKSDAYKPNIKCQGVTYENKTGRLVQKFGTANAHVRVNATNQTGFSKYGIGTKAKGNRKIVAHKVNTLTGNFECEPDYSELCAYDFSEGWYESKEGQVQFCDAEIKEDKFGPNHPIAIISYDNYLVGGKSQATAKIVPLFERRKDEDDWELDGTYCNKLNVSTDATPDADEDAPRMLPANTNYGLLPMGNNKMALYRKTAINYEKWVGGTGDLVNGSNFFRSDEADEKRVFRELVTVKITYHIPDSLYGAKGKKEDKYIGFMVQPKDCKELQWKKCHEFVVNDGDKEVDITSIFNATIENTSNDNIKYYMRGFIDESGMVNYYKGTNANKFKDGITANQEKKFDASGRDDITAHGTADRDNENLGLTDKVLAAATNFNGATHDICRLGNKQVNLKDLMVNGRLKLYHKNANKIVASTDVDNNPYFDSFVRSSYTMLVEAVFDENTNKDGGITERCLSTVNICVNQAATGFRLKANKKYYITKTETMGTIAEGKTKEQNNPDILMSEFISKVQHDDIGTNLSQIKTEGPYAFQEVSFKVVSIDDCLEICPNPDRTKGDFQDQIIRLKDIPKNKTTECPGKPISDKFAYYAHYNYERKKEYHVHVEISASRLCEIEVEKADPTYVCELDRATKPTDFGSGNDDQWRSADYKYVGTTDLSANDASGCLYYFCDPETKKYHGPLSVMPQCLEDLCERKIIHETETIWAYVRQTGNKKFGALYKTKNFKISDKPPRPSDRALMPFAIRVNDSYDKPKVAPQPYTLGKCVDYCTTDPKKGKQLDNEMIKVKPGVRFITHVYTDHLDLGITDSSDFAINEKIPSWHPNFDKTATGVNANDIKQTIRQIHPDMSSDKANRNTSYNFGLRNGTNNGKANGSNRYGLFHGNNKNDRTIVEYFVETHGCIDPSGRNEVSKEFLAGKKAIFGKQIDYSGTTFTKENTHDGLSKNKDKSDKRLYTLECLNRGRLHATNEADASDNKHRYTTASLKFEAGFSPSEGDIYRFTIAAVSNVLATANDLSYNKNMVDWNEKFYPGIYQAPDGTPSTKKHPQPFQKYAYDSSGERIITLGYAHENQSGVGSHDVSNTAIGKLDNNATGGKYFENSGADRDSSGTLLVCRTHFTVCVEDGKTTVKSESDDDDKPVIAKGLNFDSSTIIEATESKDEEYLIPKTTVSAKEGDIKLFKVDGDIVMGVYNKDGKWDQI